MFKSGVKKAQVYSLQEASVRGWIYYQTNCGVRIAAPVLLQEYLIYIGL